MKPYALLLKASVLRVGKGKVVEEKGRTLYTISRLMRKNDEAKLLYEGLISAILTMSMLQYPQSSHMA